MKITDKEIPAKEKKTIYIHARTHPCEIQSFNIAKNIIKFLSSNKNLAELIRRKCIFYILPMYNPDGVELNYSRENANTFDLESNWCSGYIQPEVIALMNRFDNLMRSDSPIAIALNLHSSMKCKRYFVFHDSTNKRYVEKQKDFIKYVRSYFSDGIEPWWFEVKWQDGIVYSSPESWWLDYYGSKVLALTFEDKNCNEASEYDKTAKALILGIYDFIEDINDM